MSAEESEGDSSAPDDDAMPVAPIDEASARAPDEVTLLEAPGDEVHEERRRPSPRGSSRAVKTLTPMTNGLRRRGIPLLLSPFHQSSTSAISIGISSVRRYTRMVSARG